MRSRCPLARQGQSPRRYGRGLGTTGVLRALMPSRRCRQFVRGRTPRIQRIPSSTFRLQRSSIISPREYARLLRCATSYLSARPSTTASSRRDGRRVGVLALAAGPFPSLRCRRWRGRRRRAPGALAAVPVAGAPRDSSEPSVRHTAALGAGDRPGAAGRRGGHPRADPPREAQDDGRRGERRRRQAGRARVQLRQQRAGQPQWRVLRRRRVHLRRPAGPAGTGGGAAAAEPGRAGVHVPGAGARHGRVQRGQRAGAGRVRRGLPRQARRRHAGRHQAAAAGPPAPGRARVPRRGGPPEPDALAAPGGAAGVLRRPEPPAAGVRVHAQRHPQEPPAPLRRRRRHGGGCEDAAAVPGRAGLADAAVHRAGLRPRAGVPARAHLPGGHPPRLQLQQRPPRPQLPRPRLRLRHRQGRLQQGQRPGPDPRPRHHRIPRARVRVDGEADDQVGRVQLRGGAPRAADRPGAGGHAAAAGAARPRLMGSSTADQPREARADGGPGPQRPVQRERSRPGCRHRGDVRADQGGVPAADDGRGAVADPHREEEPRHFLLLHSGEAPAARRLHEPAAEEAGVTRCQGALDYA